MSSTTLLTIYKGRDNAPTRQFKTGSPAEPLAFIDLGVTAMSVVLEGVEYSSGDGFVTFDNSGVVTFKLHLLEEFPEDVLVARLVAYDGGHPRGKVIISELTEAKIAFRFV